MTFAMSTEGDSVKSALSEANDKNATDHTDDSSQDSVDAKDAKAEKPVENNVNSEKKGEKPKDESTEGESDQESETSKKKVEGGTAAKKEEKAEENDSKSEENEAKVKKEEKAIKSEDEEGEEEEEEEADSKKEEKPAKEVKNTKEPKEKDEKVSTASEKDEEEEVEDEEEEEEEEEEVDEKPNKKGKKKGVPLLDQPLETSGKRERKNVQRFEEEDVKKDPAKVEFEEGSGTPLGDIPRVEACITRVKNDDLKFLHRLLFKVLGNKSTSFKKSIKKFSGFSFEKDSDEYKKKVEFLKKTDLKQLKITCENLDLSRTGTKDDLVDRIMEFLMEPKDSGKPLGGTGRPKRASAVRANNRGYSSHDDYSSDEKHASRSRRDKGKRANLKDDSSSDEEFKPGDASDASDEKPRALSKRKRGRPKKGSSEEDEASLSAGSSDESDDAAPKSKRRKSITKFYSKSKPKTPSRRGRPSKGGASVAAAGTPRSRTKRGRKVRDITSDDEVDDKADESSSSEDEPLVKKKAKASEPPTDDEIKTFIKNVLEGANLEEITMKTVCQRVYDNYPDFDLTARKNFIKSTVKSLIST